MNGAEIGISAGGACCDGECLVGIERGGFLELLLNAHHRVRFFVPVNPGDFFPRLHCQSLRTEVEILNHDLVRFGAVPRRFLLGLAEGKMGQGQEADGTQNSYGLVSGNECIHKGFTFS